MIFCQTRKTASWLAAELKKDGHAVAILSGDLGPDERILVNFLIDKKMALGHFIERHFIDRTFHR